MSSAGSGSEKGKSEAPSLGRRKFIRQSVVSLGVTIQEYRRHRDAVTKVEDSAPSIERTDWLRPPGAVDERLFLDRCTQCGDCVEACPYEAIRELPSDHTPVLFPSDSPCRLCEDFPCIQACETEALVPVEGLEAVNMGVAMVSPRACTADQGCNACVSKCPMEAICMDFSSLGLVINQARCVGCGICVQVCQSVNDRLAINIVPARRQPFA